MHIMNISSATMGCDASYHTGSSVHGFKFGHNVCSFVTFIILVPLIKLISMHVCSVTYLQWKRMLKLNQTTPVNEDVTFP